MGPRNTLKTREEDGSEMTGLKLADKTYPIRGAVFEVYREMGSGFLKATGLQLALLVNFGHSPKVEIERIVL